MTVAALGVGAAWISGKLLGWGLAAFAYWLMVRRIRHGWV